ARGDHVAAYVHRGYWIDIGTPEKYLQVHRDILRGRFPVELRGRAVSGGWIEGQADIDPAAELQGPFYIAPGCRVAAGAQVGPDAVLLAGVRVAEGARVRDAVIWEGVTVGEGARVEGALVAQGVRVGRNAVVGG